MALRIEDAGEARTALALEVRGGGGLDLETFQVAEEGRVRHAHARFCGEATNPKPQTPNNHQSPISKDGKSAPGRLELEACRFRVPNAERFPSHFRDLA